MCLILSAHHGYHGHTVANTQRSLPMTSEIRHPVESISKKLFLEQGRNSCTGVYNFLALQSFFFLLSLGLSLFTNLLPSAVNVNKKRICEPQKKKKKKI